MLHIPSGLVLITGPTGSGKTTTLASMIAQINRTRACHIMTIEDPIEYVFRRDKAMIHQREVGTDVESFSTALRSSLREDPDIILVGEMRDLETITAAINAAETGHLVFSTLHTSSAVQTIDRIIDACPLEGQNQMRSQLANVLRGIFSQQLIPMMDGTGRMVATEVLLNNTAVANLIREGKTVQITTALQSGSRQGMHTLNSELISLISMGFISREEAMKVSPNPSELERI
jgi:twitching motility protein PilT